MSISVTCIGCGQNYTVDDDKAGRRFNCKGCGEEVTVPAAAPSGSTAGYSDGGFAPSNENPYASPPSQSTAPMYEDSNGQILPQKVEIGDILNHAIEVWKRDLGVLVGAGLILIAVNIGFSMINTAIQFAMAGGPPQAGQPQDPAIILVSMSISFVGYLVQTFLGIGHTRMAIAAARGRTPEIGMLFSGGKWFLPVLGASILFSIAMVLGLLALLIGAIFVALFFWPFQYLIVDDKCGAIESFGVAKSFTGINLGTSFLLGLVSFGIMLVGLLALCIGVIFAAPLVMVCHATAYLMMSGQLRVGQPEAGY